MPAILRYHQNTALGFTVTMKEFATEAGLKHFIDHNLPSDAKNVDCWWEDASPKQRAPYSDYDPPRPPSPWFDHNRVWYN